MERIDDSYKLITGKLIHPNRGIIGISEVENLKIYEGYDGSYTTMDDIYKGGFLNKHNIDLTNEELKEIALYMSSVWIRLANKHKKIGVNRKELKYNQLMKLKHIRLENIKEIDKKLLEMQSSVKTNTRD